MQFEINLFNNQALISLLNHKFKVNSQAVSGCVCPVTFYLLCGAEFNIFYRIWFLQIVYFWRILKQDMQNKVIFVKYDYFKLNFG